jgi:hypothetical protein
VGEVTLKLFLALSSMPLYLMFYSSSFLIPYLTPQTPESEKKKKKKTYSNANLVSLNSSGLHLYLAERL